MKTIDHAPELRRRILGAFEQAEATTDPQERARLRTFVVVGADPTGVEMAGQSPSSHTAHSSNTYSTFDPREARIVPPGAASAPPFGDNLSSEAAGTLQKLGIEVRPGAPVTDVDAHGPTVRDADRTEHRTESACKA